MARTESHVAQARRRTAFDSGLISYPSSGSIRSRVQAEAPSMRERLAMHLANGIVEALALSHVDGCIKHAVLGREIHGGTP